MTYMILNMCLNIMEYKTKYERKFAALGETIKYLKFQFQ